MTDIFTISGQPVPVPDSDVAVTVTDVVGESARDRSGILHRTVLRRCKSWEFSYSRLTDAQRGYLLELLTPGVFPFTHPDGESLCCCGSFRGDYHDAAKGLWHNIRFRVEEV